MTANTRIIDMTTTKVPYPAIRIDVDHGKLADFEANFYTAPVSGETIIKYIK